MLHRRGFGRARECFSASSFGEDFGVRLNSSGTVWLARACVGAKISWGVLEEGMPMIM